DLLVAEALAAPIDDHALRPRRGRRNEAPGRHVRQLLDLRADAAPEADTAAVAARRADPPALPHLRRVLLDHLRVVDKAPGGEDHATFCADEARLGRDAFDLRRLAPPGLGPRGAQVAPCRGEPREPGMARRARVAQRQLPRLDAE